MKGVVEKYASLCHLSKKKANRDKWLLPFILEGVDERTKRRLDLDEKEAEYLKEKRVDMVVANNLNRFGV
tara:strand:+ start:172 stop:381 length:210 start_codon:yes stop_codon:yes gene_type:complete